MNELIRRITAEDLHRSVQYFRLQTDLRLTEEKIAAASPSQIAEDKNVLSRGFSRLKNRIKGTAIPPLESKRGEILEEIDRFFTEHATADVRILEREDEASAMHELFGDEPFSAARLLLYVGLVLDQEYTYIYGDASLRAVSARLCGNEETLLALQERVRALYLKLNRKPLTQNQKATLIAIGAVLASGVLTLPMAAVSLSAASLLNAPLTSGAVALCACLMGGVLFGACYGGMELHNRKQLKEAFRDMTVDEAAMALTVRCLMIEESKKVLGDESFKENVNDLLCCVDDLRADTMYELCVERHSVEDNRERVRLFHNFDNTLVSILEA